MGNQNTYNNKKKKMERQITIHRTLSEISNEPHKNSDASRVSSNAL